MAQVDAKIGNVHGPTDPVARSLGAELNLQNGAFDANLYRKPDYYVYLYTISEREFVIAQPPLVPRLIVPACPKDKKYFMFARVPHPFNQVDREAAIGDFIVRGHVAEQVAMSLVNPNNLSLDQDAVPPEKSVLGFGVDLNAQGVFWSKNNPPTDAEVKAANLRRERYYRGILERARALQIANPKELEFSITQDWHMAAEYFGVETPWHSKMVRAVDCPNCGETVKPGQAYHQNSMGIICIIDPVRAKAAGVKVPETVSTEAKS